MSGFGFCSFTITVFAGVTDETISQIENIFKGSNQQMMHILIRITVKCDNKMTLSKLSRSLERSSKEVKRGGSSNGEVGVSKKVKEQ